MLAPIILFVYNRKDHTAHTLEALKQNKLAAESSLFIFSDGAKSEEETEKIEDVRRLLYHYQKGNSFKNVQIAETKSNRGLAASVISGVTKIISEYGKAIVLEDDIVTAPDFLIYMNKALEYYEKDQRIWSISGYTLEMKSLKKYRQPVYFGYRASSWGWGTWKDRWELVDWEMKDYPDFIQDPERCKKFNRGGEDMCKMLACQMEGKIDSWAIRWCYHQSKRNMLTVYPSVSYVRNIGCDGSGTHSADSHMYDAELNSGMAVENKEDYFVAPFLEDKIVKEFHDIFSGTFKIRVRNKIRKLFGKIKGEE